MRLFLFYNTLQLGIIISYSADEQSSEFSRKRNTAKLVVSSFQSMLCAAGKVKYISNACSTGPNNTMIDQIILGNRSLFYKVAAGRETVNI